MIAKSVIATLSPRKNFAASRIKIPRTEFIASFVAVLKILYKTKAAIITRTNTVISAINVIVPSKEFYLFIIIIEFSSQLWDFWISLDILI